MVFLQSGMLLRSKNLSQAGALAVTGCLRHDIHQSVAEHHVKPCAVCDIPQNATACDLSCLESLPVTCVLLPIVSGKVINNGFELN